MIINHNHGGYRTACFAIIRMEQCCSGLFQSRGQPIVGLSRGFGEVHDPGDPGAWFYHKLIRVVPHQTSPYFERPLIGRKPFGQSQRRMHDYTDYACVWPILDFSVRRLIIIAVCGCPTINERFFFWLIHLPDQPSEHLATVAAQYLSMSIVSLVPRSPRTIKEQRAVRSNVFEVTKTQKRGIFAETTIAATQNAPSNPSISCLRQQAIAQRCFKEVGLVKFLLMVVVMI